MQEVECVDLSTNLIVKKAIPRLDKNIVKDLRVGRKKRFTPIKMRNAINKYLESCETLDEVPSISGMMISLKMYKDQFYKYLEYPEFTDMMEHTRLIIKNWVENDIYSTKGLAAGKLAYAKNLHGWAEKIDQTSNIISTSTIINLDQARAKIEMLAPRLLELLKNNTSLVNQLAIGPVVEADVVERRV